jgi:hypothetical protein
LREPSFQHLFSEENSRTIFLGISSSNHIFPLELTVRIKVPEKNNFTGIFISNSYYQGNLGEPYFFELVARKKAPSRNTFNEIGSPGSDRYE